MTTYVFAWTPLVIVGTVSILALPWLGLIALVIVSLAVLAALAVLVVLVPYTLSRVISRRLHSRTRAGTETAAPLAHRTPERVARDLQTLDMRKV